MVKICALVFFIFIYDDTDKSRCVESKAECRCDLFKTVLQIKSDHLLISDSWHQ